MKKIKLFTILAFLFIVKINFAQSPEKVNYQAVARNSNGVPLPNQSISVRASILDGSSTGTPVYQETHSISTNGLGLFNIPIGGGANISGNFNNIAWGNGDKYIQIEIDLTGGTTYVLMGTSQMLSVPYALYSSKSGTSLNDNDTSSTNEIQTISINGGSVSLSGANAISLPDSSSSNELQTLNRNNGTITISDGNSIILPDSSSTNELQTLSRTNGTINISDGNSINLPDSSSTNEFQTLSRTNGTVSISDGNSINLPDSSSTNEFQNLSRTNGTISISNGNNISLPDSSATNELQNLSFSNDTLTISQGNSVLIDNSYSFDFPHGFNGTLVYFNPQQTNTYSVPNGKVLYVTSLMSGKILVNGKEYFDNAANAKYNFTGLPVFGADTTIEITTNYSSFAGLLMNEKPNLKVVNFSLGNGDTYTVPAGKTLFIRSGTIDTYNTLDYLTVNGNQIAPQWASGSADNIFSKQQLIFPAGTVLGRIDQNSTKFGYTGYLK